MIELNRIYNECCLDTMGRMPDDFVDVVFADPPYNVGKSYIGYSDDKTPDEYLAFCKEWFFECKRISKTVVIITPGMVNVPIWLADIEKTHYLIAWSKQNNKSRNYIGKTSGFQTWEPILVYGKAKKGILRDSIDCPIGAQKFTGSHPCPKPLRLLKWIIHNFTEKYETIYDPFIGSGTTGIAAVEYNRNFIGSEISAEYCEIANKRIAPYMKQIKLFEAI